MRLVLLLCIAFILVLALPEYGMQSVQTMELFGVGTQYGARLGGLSLGLVDAWGRWLIVEYAATPTVSQCMIFPITKVLQDSQPVYCEKTYSGEIFRGWIYFRGHERPFCGGHHIPAKCMSGGN